MKPGDDRNAVGNITDARLQSGIEVSYSDGLTPTAALQSPVIEHLPLASDLYNALCSVDRAVIALDCDLHIRFFVPAARNVFNVLPGDIGRPLSDLRALVEDDELFIDAANVLVSGLPSARNVSATDNRWFTRRVLPDRNERQVILGVILVYINITEERRLSLSLEQTCSELENLKIANSRALISISHDLRQPLQSLILLRDALRKSLSDNTEKTRTIDQFDCCLSAMVALLDSLHNSDSIVSHRSPHLVVDVEAAVVSPDAATTAQSLLEYRRLGMVLLVEDDSNLRNSLANALNDNGFNVVAVENASSALELADHGAIQPDAVLSDYNLPGNLDGIALGLTIRARLQREIPLIVLTGDVSEIALEILNAADCWHLTKPVGIADLVECLAAAMMDEQQIEPIPPVNSHFATKICIVDDEGHARDLIKATLEEEGYSVAAFCDAEDFLAAKLDPASLCLLLDLRLPGIGGVELLTQMLAEDTLSPTIVLSAVNDPQQVLYALKAGAIDFLLKPVPRRTLLASVEQGVARVTAGGNSGTLRRQARQMIGQLTERQQQVMSLILAGHPNKIIAADLGVSQRTIENHRAAIMQRTGTRSVPELARLSIAAGMTETA